MKTFTYTKITSSHGDEDYGDEFDYTVEREDLLDAVVDIVCMTYFWLTIKHNVKRFINNTDILDELVDYYEDELKDYFKEKAYEQEEDNG